MHSAAAVLFTFIVHVFVLTDAEMLECYACDFSYWYVDFQPDSWCADRNLTAKDRTGNIRPCAEDELCFTEVKVTSETFTSVSRGCSVKDDCNIPMCTSQGFGTDIVTCRKCCGTNKCNNDTSVKDYKAMVATAVTSWVTPVEGEENYNNISNIRLYQ